MHQQEQIQEPEQTQQKNNIQSINSNTKSQIINEQEIQQQINQVQQSITNSTQIQQQEQQNNNNTNQNQQIIALQNLPTNLNGQQFTARSTLEKSYQCFTKKTFLLTSLATFLLQLLYVILADDPTIKYGYLFSPVYIFGILLMTLIKESRNIQKRDLIILIPFFLIFSTIVYVIQILVFRQVVQYKFHQANAVLVGYKAINYNETGIESIAGSALYHTYYSFQFLINFQQIAHEYSNALNTNFSSNQTFIGCAGGSEEESIGPFYPQFQFQSNQYNIDNVIIPRWLQICNDNQCFGLISNLKLNNNITVNRENNVEQIIFEVPPTFQMFYAIHGNAQKALNNKECPPKSLDFIHIYNHSRGQIPLVNLIVFYLVAYQIYLFLFSMMVYNIILLVFKSKIQLKYPIHIYYNEEQQEKVDKSVYLQFLSYKELLQEKLKNDLLNLSESKNCAICLEVFLLQSKLIVTLCGHIFHEKCLEIWLIKKNHCPYCRQPFNRRAIEIFKSQQEKRKQLQEKIEQEQIRKISQNLQNNFKQNDLGQQNDEVKIEMNIELNQNQLEQSLNSQQKIQKQQQGYIDLEKYENNGNDKNQSEQNIQKVKQKSLKIGKKQNQKYEQLEIYQKQSKDALQQNIVLLESNETTLQRIAQFKSKNLINLGAQFQRHASQISQEEICELVKHDLISHQSYQGEKQQIQSEGDDIKQEVNNQQKQQMVRSNSLKQITEQSLSQATIKTISNNFNQLEIEFSSCSQNNQNKNYVFSQ